ncbi:MAG: hypothetical protein ACRDYX_08210 [Egibacteraceae bacterium]
MTRSELEDRTTTDGRELLLALLQGHLDARAANEADLEEAVGADGIERTRLERDLARTFATVVGEVNVARRHTAPQAPNLRPADAALSFPPPGTATHWRSRQRSSPPAGRSRTRPQRSGV